LVVVGEKTNYKGCVRKRENKIVVLVVIQVEEESLPGVAYAV